MKSFFKYLLLFILFITILSTFLFKTSIGIKTLSRSLSYICSDETNKIEVSYLNIDNYPIISMNIDINSGTTLYINGILDIDDLNMSYHLYGDKFRYKRINIDDKIDIKGEIVGSFFKPKVVGRGFIQSISNSLNFSLNSKIEFKSIEAKYNLYINRGDNRKFDTTGDIEYHQKELIIKGESNTLKGSLTYLYLNNKLIVNLDGVSLLKALKFTKYKSPISAKIYGYIDFDIDKKIATFNTKLKETKFMKTAMSNKILYLTNIDITRDIYNHSSFIGGYSNYYIYSTLKIDNKEDRYIYLNNIKIDTRKESIYSDIELKIGEKNIYGNLSGKLKKPKISIDIEKSIKYKLKKELNYFFEIDSENINLQNAKNKAKNFLKKLF